MAGGAGVTRREVGRGLVALALAAAGGRIAIAAPGQPLFDFAIAGGHYHGLAGALGRIQPGTAVTLRREPDNPFDADAVAVLLDGVKLGYLPRAANAPIARLLDAGAGLRAEVVRLLAFGPGDDLPEDLVFTSVASGEPVIRLSVAAPAA